MQIRNALVPAVVALLWIASAGSISSRAADKTLPGPDEFVKVDVLPEMIYQQQPEYPPLARKAAIEGAVWVKSLVDSDGNVVEVMLAKTSGSELLDKAALVAAEKNRFKPAVQDGKPVAVWVTFKVDFVLDDKSVVKRTPPQRIPIVLDDKPAESTTEGKLPKSDEFVKVGIQPELIYQHSPDYPTEAKKSGIEGTVWIKSLVDADGNAVKVMLAKTSGSDLLDKAALIAAEKNRFKPAVQDGKPVAVWVTFKTEFVLSE
ncbi:MAG: energy transducer TonB [candidate division Zixibacteria bacterium]|nr:energy transducer TonB [candidate division Zixibacteria bacterium]